MLGGMLALASCQDDAKSEAPATVSITSPQADEKVWLNTPLTAEVATAKAGNKVMFYLDGELLGEDTEAPYELMLDTKLYEDGAYTLRTVAQNGSGEQTEATQTINIFNKLFSLEVDDNYLKGYRFAPQEAWLIACDTEGNIIQTDELQNGETINVNRHDRKDEKLIITLVKSYLGRKGNQYVIIDSYQDIPPNAWFFRGYRPADKSVIGTAEVNYEVPGGMRSMAYAANALVALNNADRFHWANLEIFEEPTDLFITNHTLDGGAATYAWLDDVRVGQERSLGSDDFQPMQLMQRVSFPPVDEMYFSASGISEQTGGYYNLLAHSWGDEVVDELLIHHPEGLFDRYHYSVSIVKENVTYRRKGTDAIKSNYTVPEVSADVVEEGQGALIQVQGEYGADFVEGRWNYYSFQDSTTDVVAWYVHAPIDGGECRAHLHELPAKITDRHVLIGEAQMNMEYKSLELVNYDSVSSLPSYLNTRYQSEVQSALGAREDVTIQATEAQGGRSVGSLPKSVIQEIEELRQQ